MFPRANGVSTFNFYDRSIQCPQFIYLLLFFFFEKTTIFPLITITIGTRESPFNICYMN